MSYKNGLKALRAKLLSGATGQEVEQERGIESFIPARGGVEQQSQETTEDLLSRGATWLTDIRKASQEFNKALKTGEAYNPDTSGIAEAARNLAQGLTSKVKGKENEVKPEEEDESEKSFVKRRSSKEASELGNSYKPVPEDAEIGPVLEAIAAVESRGSGDYSAIGTEVKSGMYKGEKALGRYQVMPGNLPQWSKEALGKTITPEEFLNNPEYQDAIAAHQLTKARNKFGTWEDAASVWFSGRSLKAAGNASDGQTTVPQYITKFRKNFVR